MSHSTSTMVKTATGGSAHIPPRSETHPPTETITKVATKRANTKLAKAADKEDKPKRQPTAYNLFVQAKMKEWKTKNPNAPIKEAMIEIGQLWRDAPENPNRGKVPKPRKPKAAAAPPPKTAESEESSDAIDS
ncbi:hypothetical protein V8B97DRAFT_1984890 [Scleroderma yunnanense]